MDLTANQSSIKRSRELLINLRRITRVIELQSKYLTKHFGLTGPQLVILQELSNHGPLSVSELSQSVSLSQGTVTDIVIRIEKKGLVIKERCSRDKRRVIVQLTSDGRTILSRAPSALQNQFVESFSELEDWEQLMILCSTSRIVSLMSAEKIDASPFLTSGPIHDKSVQK